MEIQPTLSTRGRIVWLGSTILLVTERSVCCQEFFLKNNKRWLFTGVLTKPDRIPATEEDNWVPYIRGEREDTTMWFCVKCPNSEAIKLGVTWEEARRDESLWFSRKVPWATLEEAYRQRLGTANLTRCLSDKLCDLIAERFVYPPKCPQTTFALTPAQITQYRTRVEETP
jgi:hypothetical protein